MVEHIYESIRWCTVYVRLSAHPVRLVAHIDWAADGNALRELRIENWKLRNGSLAEPWRITLTRIARQRPNSQSSILERGLNR